MHTQLARTLREDLVLQEGAHDDPPVRATGRLASSGGAE